MTLEAYRTEFYRQAAHPRFITSRSNISDGAQLDPVPIPPSPNPNKKLLAVQIFGGVKVSSGATATVTFTLTKGGSPLDFFLQRVRVRADQGSAIRSNITKRSHIEAFEQLAFNLNKGSYPTSTQCVGGTTDTQFPTTNKIVNAHTNYVYANAYIAVGGDSAAIEIDVPPTPTTGSNTTGVIAATGAVTTANRYLNFYAIYGDDSSVITMNSVTTPPMPSGSTFSVWEYLPARAFTRPDFIGIKNWNGVNRTVIETNESGTLVNTTRANFPKMQISTPDMAPTMSVGGNTLTPSTNQLANAVNLLWFATNRQTVTTATMDLITTTSTLVADLLGFECAEGDPSTAKPEPRHVAPVNTPASTMVPAPGGNVPGVQRPTVRRVA